jgi:hypothetical protein
MKVEIGDSGIFLEPEGEQERFALEALLQRSIERTSLRRFAIGSGGDRPLRNGVSGSVDLDEVIDKANRGFKGLQFTLHFDRERGAESAQAPD